ncbi:MAG: hypothetical protein U5O39_09030 [Gammaproteobacteria bacterium]|nr:hypothetical protein [Gammaproteobacteria bacterium]
MDAPQDIGGQQIRRELNSFEGRVDGGSEGFGQRRFARAGHVLQKYVSTREEGGKQPANAVIVATHDGADIRLEAIDHRCGGLIGRLRPG